MILSFKTQINGKPTYFPEKIWQGFPDSESYIEQWFTDGKIYEGYDFHPDAFGMFPKLHTIRKDEKGRWKKDVMIDFFINARTKNMFRFAPKIPVVSIQNFRLFFFTDAPYCYNVPAVYIDEKFITGNDLLQLVQNDGFDDVKSFFEYFNEDFEGKILHWTDLRY